uniref:DNA topoisomerase n=1 Tax=Cupriavidus gilardii TaxID=82541 RepID=UPI00247A3ACA|nr:DNA topoisomerase [Cupriavidus gilardii]WDE72622.1 DNA topoisomerase III [Cupriavidus gilardii]
MKDLIIAEKPSVAADIAKAIGDCRKVEGHYFESDRFIVASARGHLAKQVVPPGEDRGSNLSVLPLIPSRFDLQPIEETEDVLRQLVKLIKRPDVAAVVNACDAGREGELIFHYIYSFAKCAKPVKRMWLQSMTHDAIRQELSHMKDGAAFQPLRDAAVCRAESDWLVGINATRGVSKLFEMINCARDLMPAGRVQTPVLAMTVELENRIRSFQARPYWELIGTFSAAAGTYEGTWVDPGFSKGDDDDATESRLFDQATALSILQRCKAAAVTNVRETSEEKRELPPRLFDLTSLQREANKRYGMSAKRTLDVAQALYETHKVLSYPRTDSTALPEDYLDTVRGLFDVLAQGDYGQLARKAIDHGFVRHEKRIFDNGKISDHYAIIPTMQPPDALSEDEKRIYDLVVRRFIAAFFPAARFNKTVRLTIVGNDVFKSNGSVLVEPGWMEVNGRDASEEHQLAMVAAGERPSITEIATKAKQTKPPKRFTEDTLLAAMESAGKRVDDEELREQLKAKGLGTPATRAATIEGLISSAYLFREGKELIPTEKGLRMIGFLMEQRLDFLCSPAMTGEWEKRLKMVENGGYSRPQFMSEIRAVVEQIIGRLQEQAANSPQVAAAKLDARCPSCGGEIREEALFYACGGCALKVWKIISKRRISRAEATQLLTTGKTQLLAGFVSTKAKPFSAHLVYRAAENKVAFEFPDSGFACPDCGKPLIHRSKPPSGRRRGYSFFGCSGYPECDAAFEDNRGSPGKRAEKRAKAL